MSVKEKLNEAWHSDKMTNAVFEFRATVENAFNVLQEAITRIDEIASSANFADVEEEIKQTGVAIRKILEDAKEALSAHNEFITWTQPE